MSTLLPHDLRSRLPPTGEDEKCEMVQALRRIAAELRTDSVSRAEFLRHSSFPERRIQLRFGSYNGLVEAAGLVPRRFPSAEAPTYSTEDLLAEIVRVLRLPKSKLTRIFFEQHSGISVSACQRRFGGWIQALKAAGDKLDPEQDSSLLARIRKHTGPQIQASRAAVLAAKGGLASGEDARALPGSAGAGDVPVMHGDIYGDFINFGGLAYAPVNEQGVVFLFGMICRELGYVVEIVKPAFPDCEAKRQLRPGIWQRVRIEFEFRSRTFRTHGHDPDQCDLIVCWENNWPECPIEVLELKSALQRLSRAATTGSSK
jgi:hypothetical protein